jgi:hypothetical protein
MTLEKYGTIKKRNLRSMLRMSESGLIDAFVNTVQNSGFSIVLKHLSKYKSSVIVTVKKRKVAIDITFTNEVFRLRLDRLEFDIETHATMMKLFELSFDFWMDYAKENNIPTITVDYGSFQNSWSEEYNISNEFFKSRGFERVGKERADIWSHLFFNSQEKLKINDWYLLPIELEKNTQAKLVEIVKTFEDSLKDIQENDPVLEFSKEGNGNRRNYNYYYHGFRGQISCELKNGNLEFTNLRKDFPVNENFNFETPLEEVSKFFRLHFRALYETQRLSNLLNGAPTYYFDKYVNTLGLNQQSGKELLQEVVKHVTSEIVERDLSKQLKTKIKQISHKTNSFIFFVLAIENNYFVIKTRTVELFHVSHFNDRSKALVYFKATILEFTELELQKKLESAEMLFKKTT